jgi:thiosulfate/3-mercaptopyruvate sulfurtransferase
VKLNEHLNRCASDIKTDIHILHCEMPLGTAKKHNLKREIRDVAIPGAIHFDFQGVFSDSSSHLSTTMCSSEKFQTEYKKLGLKPTNTIVIYDIFGNFCASRVWFMFKTMGFTEVYVLDGGLPNWIDSGFTVEKLLSNNQTLLAVKAEEFTIEPSKEIKFVDQGFIEQIVATSGEEDSLIVDVRSAKRFTGEEGDPRPNVRKGRIPKSVNLHFRSVLDNNSKFLPRAQLIDIFKHKGYFDKELVFSCGSGITACIVAQAAHLSGISSLKVYDGSWSQWGANHSLPIETDCL